MDHQPHKHITLISRYRFLSIAAVALLATTAAAQDAPQPFRFSSNSFSPSQPVDFPPPPAPSNDNRPPVRQALPLRATFRPLNRQPQSTPSPPLPPSPPDSSAIANLIGDNPLLNSEFPLPSSRRSSAAPPSPRTTPKPPRTTTTPNSSSGNNNDDDELPTRQPLSRFRPTRAPSDDEDSPVSVPTGGGPGAASNGNGVVPAPPPSSLFNFTSAASSAQQQSPLVLVRITNECYECICEASTSCNANSRCQTSDVRHTRCGMFLISYDQWLATELSRELVTSEQLARDPAADERAFYECATRRDCAERLLAIYLERNSKDCDKDGRLDCYDLAAIHHSGVEQCASESLLDSQYWSDFNACFGFGRRR